MKKQSSLYLALIFSVAVVATGVAYSHEGASGVVKQRMDAMGDMGDHSRQVADMFKGKTEFDSDAIAEAAEAFIEHGKTMPSLFPDTVMSRTGSKTEALPAIWSRWADFTESADKLVARSERLKAVVSTTDKKRALKRAFFKTTKSCSSCHKRFRKPQD